eukprot:Skav231516  [mRNA]  locus=scaffold84:526841:533270:- [translate_table: standard]
MVHVGKLLQDQRPAVLLLASYVRGQLNAVTSALDAATRAGLTVVVAATDRGLSAHPNACDYTPGFVESVLTVGASTRQDTQALTSSWGTCVITTSQSRPIGLGLQLSLFAGKPKLRRTGQRANS